MTRFSRRPSVIACALLAAVALVATACGVPSSGKPILDGPATTRDSATGSGGSVTPPKPNQFQPNRAEAQPFIETGYLEAAVGQVGKAQQSAVTAFMDDSLKRSWSSNQTPNQQINVVRLKQATVTTTVKDQQITGFIVVEKVLQVGVFDPQSGLLKAPPASAPGQLSFTITVPPAGARGPAVQPGNTMLLTSAPSGLYMNEDALHQSSYYTPHVIYFWDADHGLIPDLRYQSTGLSAVSRATAVVNWVLAGPPPWMAGIAAPTTPGLLLADNTLPTNGNTFVVDLNSAARALSPTDQADLVAQIRWSLGDIHPSDQEFDQTASAVQLKIGNQQVRLDNDLSYQNKNQASIRPTPPTEYAIDGGKVRRIVAGPAVPELPNGAPNKGVLLAAVNESLQSAVFVRSTASGPELWVWRGTKTFGPLEPSSSFHPATFQRPVWLVQPAGAFVFVADGKFYVVTAKNQVLNVSVPNLARVDAFSIAPDGRQVAFVADGDLWTSLLETGAQPSASAPPSLTSPRLISVRPALSEVTAVAWSAVDQLIVAGTGQGSAGATAIEMFVDGTYANKNPQVTTLGTTKISQIVSYPLSPGLASAASVGSLYVMMQVSSSTSSYACVGRASCQPLSWQGGATGSSPASPFYPD